MVRGRGLETWRSGELKNWTISINDRLTAAGEVGKGEESLL